MRYYGGCDSGSTFTKCVILDETGKIVSDVTLRSRINSVLSAQEALDQAVAKVPELQSGKDLAYLVGTGYGRNKVPFADENISEISCHAMGVHVADPSVKAIIDIGGQDVKGISVDSDGTVLNFAMNDKCAAGTGRFLDVMANILVVPVDEFAQYCEKSLNPAQISSTCTVFAESEVISQLANGVEMEDLIAGICSSVAVRVGNLAKRIN
ncbi:MAG: activase, partial [Clostridia bacterium]|nr:activase [Clostridia bacterium]